MSNNQIDFMLSKFKNSGEKTISVNDYEKTDDFFLMHMIYHAMQNNDFLVAAAEYLQPLVRERIMKIDNLATKYVRLRPDMTHGDAIFKGSDTFGKGNPYSFGYVQDNSHINDFYLNKGEYGVARLLYQLEFKTEALKKRKEESAYLAASNLHTSLRTTFLEYLDSNKEEKAKNDLNSKWNDAILKAKPELEKHRGWSNFVVNLLLILPTLGCFMLFAGYQSNGKNFLFPFVDTDSSHLIKKLKQIVEYTDTLSASTIKQTI